MIIDEQQLIKLCRILILKYFKHPNIIIKEIDLKITDVFKVYLHLSYCNIETEISLSSTIDINEDTITMVPKGIIKYGFIQLDLLKVIEESIHDYPWISLKNNRLYIENLYIKEMKLYNQKIELSLK